MKLRIRGDSLRFRLSQGEVRRLHEEGVVEDVTAFGDSRAERFVYRLEAGSQTATISGELMSVNGPGIVVAIPKSTVAAWATSSEVGMTVDQRTSGERRLRISIEKDFACLKPREEEDDADAFPNPNETCS